MSKLNDEHLLRWHCRILGEPEGKDLQELHRALSKATTSIYGHEGIAALSLRSGYEVSTKNPEQFEYHSIRIHLSGIVIFAHLFTACTLKASNQVEGRDIRIVLVEKGVGETEIIIDGIKRIAQKGAPVYLSTKGNYEITSHGLGDGFGIVLPESMTDLNTDEVAGVLPATPYTSATFAFLRNLLAQSLKEMYYEDRVPKMAPDARKALKMMVYAIFQQDSDNSEDARAERIRQQVRELIELNHRRPDFSVKELATKLHMSRRQLYRYFNEDGVASMLAARRAYTARVYIEHHRELSIAEIAVRSGFSDATRLREHFKKTFNMLPSEYRTKFDANYNQAPQQAISFSDSDDELLLETPSAKVSSTF